MAPRPEDRHKLVELLNEFKMENYFPNYLIDLLTYTGYSSCEALSLFEETDRNKLEEFAQQTLPELLSNDEKENFYGVFLKKTAIFRIVEGDKKALDKLVSNCRKKIKNFHSALDTQDRPLQGKSRGKSLKRSVARSVACKERYPDSIEVISVAKKRKQLNEVNEAALIENEGQSCSQHNSEANETTDETIEEVKRISEEHICNIVKKYQIAFLKQLKNVNNKEEIETEIETMKTPRVEVRDDIAYVLCHICGFKSKAYCVLGRYKQRWVLSNVNRHFKTHFKNLNATNKSKILTTDCEKKRTIYSYFSAKPLNENKKSASDCNNSSSDLLSSDNIGTGGSTEEEIQINNLEPAAPLAQNIDPALEIPNNNLEVVDLTSTSQAEYVQENLRQCSQPRRSRATKACKSREMQLDINQLKMTDYFDICEKIKCQIQECPSLKTEFTLSANLFFQQKNLRKNIDEFTDSKKNTPSDFFDAIKMAASKNSDVKAPSANRYPHDLKKLCLYLFLISGRLAYQTLVANIPRGLPSISTVLRSLSGYYKFSEGEVAMSELKDYLNQRNYPLHVFISEDQTAIVRRPRYNPATNQLIGYVFKKSQRTGFPKAPKMKSIVLQT
ncbi:hypothetical protein RI129_013055 [Pyrocoelia pectoralis]|uniref:Uncharacterized protein n=1 Tax=Pyrocoelia pectoralis TaxID=417401 RepID=A0AAN7UVF7_9COLE